MGPLQVLYDTIDEPLYDGQICLAEFILRILFGNILFKYYTSVVKHRNPRYCLASVLRDDPSVVPSGGWVWIKMCITCEPITYIMLNGSVSITGHCITYKIIYTYITI